MMKFKIFNLSNSEVGILNVDKNIEVQEKKRCLLSEIINWQRATRRSAIQSAKTKGEVSGTTKKPFPQKGRGVARQGSLKNPHQYGGGVAFAPKPRNYCYSIPKTKKKIGIITALSIRYNEESLKVLDHFDPQIYKTAFVRKVFKTLSIPKALIIDDKNHILRQCINNLSNYKYIDVNSLNVYDILKYPFLIITKKAFVILNKLYFN